MVNPELFTSSCCILAALDPVGGPFGLPAPSHGDCASLSSTLLRPGVLLSHALLQYQISLLPWDSSPSSIVNILKFSHSTASQIPYILCVICFAVDCFVFDFLWLSICFLCGVYNASDSFFYLLFSVGKVCTCGSHLCS